MNSYILTKDAGFVVVGTVVVASDCGPDAKDTATAIAIAMTNMKAKVIPKTFNRKFLLAFF